MIDPVAIWRAFCPASTATSGVAPVQAVRDEQVTVTPEGVRFEVRHGDVYRDYSDARALITGPAEMWEDEGNDRWYRWRAMWPVGWVGSYPKWDQPGARSSAGSSLEWHHEPLGGGVESGSAPLYIGADDSFVWLHLVDEATSEVRQTFSLAPLVRGLWFNFIFHIKWSSTVGLIEVWANGVKVMGYAGKTMYPNTRMYPCAGLYRNGHIGEDAPDGLPGVCYAGGFARGATRLEVEPVAPVPAVSLKAAAMLKRFIDQQADLLDLISMMDILRSHAQAIYDKNKAILDAGPPW